ncbi:MAG TPA: methyl-accepting chemotaxis protein [Pyrinomonadaceae bacterium]|nr:methyl-accepting chemotaxis protein [Pyrinomonadaceae bacterium]
MDNPLLFLLSRIAAVVSGLLLAMATMLAASAYFAASAFALPGLAAVFLGTVAAVAALAASHLENSSLRAKLSRSVDIAERLALGERPSIEMNGELLEALGGISQYLHDKAAMCDRIAEGKLSDSFNPISEADELGVALRNMAASLRESVQTRSDRERLHESVVKLLDEVSEVAAGDLTVRADVDTEITGAIANAFNSMTESLRRLIYQVKHITNQVGTSAGSIRDTVEQLARGSFAQAGQITRTTAAMAKMAAQIQEVSVNAERSSKVASESLNRARSGTKAATENIDAMRCVRKQVQETAKRVKRLGERSQEIGQIVELIDDLSDRTSLLALNASLQASAAGEAGAAFASVAEEVERLAERSNRLTRQVSDLTETINSETKDVVASMEDTIREVIVGSTLADKAGQALFSIETTSIRLAELLRSISDSAKFQAKSSEDISNAMASISEVTEIVESGSKRAAESVRSLVKLSEELQGSVSPFKLPATVATSVHEGGLRNGLIN